MSTAGGGAMSEYDYVSVFAPYIVQFIDFKRNLGYKFHCTDSLRAFDRFAEKNDIQSVELTREVCNSWAEKRPNESDVTRYKRISAVRNFSRFMNSLGVPSYVPRLPGNCKSTFTPHIYSHDEINKLFAECDKLTITTHTYSAPLYPALFRILYGTGIRLGEALALRRKDVNLDDGIITLHGTKNGEDRLLPISDSLRGILSNFASVYAETKPDGYFFTKRNGKPLAHSDAYKMFRSLLLKSGIPYCGRESGPRIHDFRHTFSVHSLSKMSEDGLDLYYSLPILSKYLGHKSLEATDKYVRLTEEMFPSVLEKANKICACVFPEVTRL
jgi:integrase